MAKAKKTKQIKKVAPAKEPVVNLKLVLEGLEDTARNLCQCGHWDSEHFFTKQLKPADCAECKCKKFTPLKGVKISFDVI